MGQDNTSARTAQTFVWLQSRQFIDQLNVKIIQIDVNNNTSYNGYYHTLTSRLVLYSILNIMTGFSNRLQERIKSEFEFQIYKLHPSHLIINYPDLNSINYNCFGVAYLQRVENEKKIKIKIGKRYQKLEQLNYARKISKLFIPSFDTLKNQIMDLMQHTNKQSGVNYIFDQTVLFLQNFLLFLFFCLCQFPILFNLPGQGVVFSPQQSMHIVLNNLFLSGTIYPSSYYNISILENFKLTFDATSGGAVDIYEFFLSLCRKSILINLKEFHLNYQNNGYNRLKYLYSVYKKFNKQLTDSDLEQDGQQQSQLYFTLKCLRQLNLTKIKMIKMI